MVSEAATKQPAYLTDRQAATRYSVSRNTVWRWAKDGSFPKPVQLSPQCTRWRLEDLKAWEANQ
ncbi:hypothetical protein HHSLTHF2_11050 [Vreelandella venusta]|jgi:predicted DNA-binding transcriptional regulator AlpA|uniref:Helix-turn-helix domain-containing protein n=1 Tax=Halomonas hydrothermalis TaxID=115561 RepID=A0A6F8U2V0_9GAMM|nr:AlpA family phage regulatory protein [Halomonas hydrothermalis]BCB07215.1 hypothetical protein HHSLTHF2_11050 [Halomonas hydrothermalis]